jgi:hypothetical protein
MSAQAKQKCAGTTEIAVENDVALVGCSGGKHFVQFVADTARVASYSYKLSA